MQIVFIISCLVILLGLYKLNSVDPEYSCYASKLWREEKEKQEAKRFAELSDWDENEYSWLDRPDPDGPSTC